MPSIKPFANIIFPKWDKNFQNPSIVDPQLYSIIWKILWTDCKFRLLLRQGRDKNSFCELGFLMRCGKSWNKEKYRWIGVQHKLSKSSFIFNKWFIAAKKITIFHPLRNGTHCEFLLRYGVVKICLLKKI